MAKRRIKHHPIVKFVGQRLHDERRRVGMTQQDLADKSKISVSYVARLERGEAAAGVDVLAQLATALGIAPGSLLGLDSDQAQSLSVIQTALKEKAAQLSERTDVHALQAASLILHLMDNALAHRG